MVAHDEQAREAGSELHDGSRCRSKTAIVSAAVAGMTVYAAVLALTIAVFALPARTVAGTWVCGDFHGGACTIEVLPGGTCSMRYESERGARRGIYDLSGAGTCSVHGDRIEFAWEKAALGKGSRRQEAPQVSRETAELNDGGESFSWDGFTFTRMGMGR